jgi:hypothetical protein
MSGKKNKMISKEVIGWLYAIKSSCSRNAKKVKVLGMAPWIMYWGMKMTRSGKGYFRYCHEGRALMQG